MILKEKIKMIKNIKKRILKRFTKNYWEIHMSGNWHKKRQKEAYDDFETFAQAVYDKTEDLSFDIAIEVGTGGGLLITNISKKLNSNSKYIGIDINKQQIADNIDRYKDLSNVEFVYIGIDEYINNNNLNNVVIVAQNTFDYFKKEELEKLFSLIYNRIDNIAIAISTEKANEDIDDSIDRKQADFKVYNHNYSSLLKTAGYELMSVDSYGKIENNVIVVGKKWDI